MRTAVDTSVLLDVFTASPEFGPASSDAVREAYFAGSVIACDVVWAEVRAYFTSDEACRAMITSLGVRFDAVSDVAAELAGRLWREHRRRATAGRSRIIGDFLIGAHATMAADALITRDRGFYRGYFRGLQIIDPSPRR